MLNFKSTILITAMMVAAIIVMIYFADIQPWWLTLPALYFLILTVWGSSTIQSDFFIKAESNGNDSGMVALTFDDGPVPGKTESILNILKSNGVKATFFCIGNRIEKHPELAKRIIEEGHIIGNHSYSHHPAIDFFPESKLQKELNETNQITETVTGVKMRMFRPPYGVTTPPLANTIRKNQFICVGWSIRSLDTVIHNDQKLINRVTNRIKGGDIVLLHDTSDTTIRSLQTIIDKIRSKGLGFTSVDRLIGKEAYA